MEVPKIVWEALRGATRVDVMPVRDLKDHEPGAQCWCHPKIENWHNPDYALIVHNTLDWGEPFTPRGTQYVEVPDDFPDGKNDDVDRATRAAAKNAVERSRGRLI